MTASRRLGAVMFTDMAGYTALFQADERDAIARRDAYVAAVERAHDDYGGTIVQRLGDGTMSTFPSAATAVEAAVSMQRILQRAGVEVRIGIHAGEIIHDGATILGDTVNVASRIESFSVVGAVLVSEAVRDLLHNRPDLGFADLGPFRLKNVGRPMELFCVRAEGIVVPEAASLEGKGERLASLPTNIPSPRGQIFGRESELKLLADAVRAGRLVTITGPGGIGKTRLLVELGNRLLMEFLEGVTFVGLADVESAADLIPTLAEHLGAKEAEGRSLAEGVAALIGTKRALLLLDNFEQLLDAAPSIGDLVATCPELHVVVTSRTPLRLAAEDEVPLAPLALPAEGDATIENLQASPAVSLFVDRARTPTGPLALTEQNAAAVAAICRRLDGLPLALELAAARLRILTPQALLERLAHALDVLTTGSRDLPARHQTLRATIDWSYSLLDEDEQRLLRRMSIFSGGCTIEVLEAVCHDGAPSLDALESLVEKALVQISPTGRCTMLQTIAEYAGERLAASGELDEIAARHAAALIAVIRDVREGLELGRQVASLERGIVEEQNISAALETLLTAAERGDPSAIEAGQQACGDLHLYWHLRGKNITAREVSKAFLAAGEGLPSTAATASALRTAGLGAWALGHVETANEEWRVARDIASEVGDVSEECLCATFLAFGHIGLDAEFGKRCAAEGLELARAMKNSWAEGAALVGLGFIHLVSGEPDDAGRRLGEALAVAQQSDDCEVLGLAYGGLAALAAGSDAQQALDLYELALTSFERVGDRAEEARILSEMASVSLALGDVTAARQRLHDSVRAYRDLGSVRGVGLAVIGLAAVASLEGDHETSVAIATAGERYAQEDGIVNVYADGTPGLELVNRSREVLDAEALQRALAKGRTLTVEDAVALSFAPR